MHPLQQIDPERKNGSIECDFEKENLQVFTAQVNHTQVTKLI